ncbi:hypothetical protein [Flavobacterium solisilvae]|uniref:Uncharacterized protein n=1 Tax=Flavobacterium solisilvae TaxID=1852019 RepID=A0ABX1QST1_9FLAO|nr:hypothetical protein [Flavobacterium solisilvae]NMH24520.1 hypothetical protein [Flavobacterium solisilvae]
MFYFSSKKAFKVEGGFDLELPSKKTIISIKENYPFIEQRNKIIFSFNSSLKSEDENIKKFQKALNQFNHKKDTVNSINVYFGKQMQYEVFIKILEIAEIEKTPTYMVYKNELLITNISSSEIEKTNSENKSTTMNCGTQDYIRKQKLYNDEQNRLLENEKFQKSFFKKHWYLFLALSVLALINLYFLIKFNRNRKYNQKSYI